MQCHNDLKQKGLEFKYRQHWNDGPADASKYWTFLFGIQIVFVIQISEPYLLQSVNVVNYKEF
jgi:hypothetical protein